MEPLNTSTEPVVDGAKIVAGVVGIVGGLATIGVLIGVLHAEDVPGLVGAATTATTGVITLLGVVLPLWQARKVRQLVTPVIDPRSDNGVPLVPITADAVASAEVPAPDGPSGGYITTVASPAADFPAGPDYATPDADVLAETKTDGSGV